MKLSIMVYTVYVVGMLCSACSHSYRDKKGIDGTMGLSNGTLSNDTMKDILGNMYNMGYIDFGLLPAVFMVVYYGIKKGCDVWNKKRPNWLCRWRWPLARTEVEEAGREDSGDSREDPKLLLLTTGGQRISNKVSNMFISKNNK